MLPEKIKSDKRRKTSRFQTILQLIIIKSYIRFIFCLSMKKKNFSKNRLLIFVKILKSISIL